MHPLVLLPFPHLVHMFSTMAVVLRERTMTRVFSACRSCSQIGDKASLDSELSWRIPLLAAEGMPGTTALDV
jgi:hypothetical protein